MKITAIIPTFNPSEKICAVVDRLYERGFPRIIVINDGSEEHCRPIFEALRENPHCVVLEHSKNLGKGQALKTAFGWYLENQGEELGVITLDDDGQHDLQGVVDCAVALCESPQALVLGVRDFSAPSVPPKSRFGNKITSAVFALSCGLRISDTQTGLRAIPNRWLPVFMEVPGERFEYETNMLLATKQNNIPIREVSIRTIYVAGNRETHFRPLVDSLRIYRQLLRFLFSSLLAFAVDISLFWLVCQMPLGDMVTRVFWATFLARAISSVVNFLTNRRVVFRKSDTLLPTASRYYLLCVGQAALSFLLVSGLGMVSAGRWLTPWKLLVDGVLFCLSFRIQKRWVFRPAAREA